MAQSTRDRHAPLTHVPLTPDELERTGLIDFSASHDSELPVGTQLVWKLKAMIARGALRSGDRLPSVRELAGFAGVNVNTARAAYVALEADSLIASEHGRGTYVTERSGELLALGTLAQETLRRAREGGIDRAELAAAIWAAGAAESRGALPEHPLPPLDPEAGAATLRRELRAQIARMETELAAYAWHDPRRPPPQRVETAIPVGRVVSVEELGRTRDELIERLTRLRGEAERRGAREQASRTHVEDMVADPASHGWEMVTSEETGDPDCKNWRVVPRWGPLGAIMGWWRVKVSSGCPLPGPLAAASEIRVNQEKREGGEMVKSVADRAFLPAKGLFEQVGNMMILTGKTLTATVRPPYPFGGEFISQFLFALKLCWFPMTISTVAVTFGAPGLQAANFLSLFGALDRLGGFFILAAVREFAPLVTAVVVAGVAGTAITADLGARKIREELDALMVLGVDPIKNLVVPRFLSLMLITGLLNIYAIFFGISGGILAELSYGQPLGGFFATLFNNASIVDLWGSVLKTTLFGAIVAIVCSYKGMNASGGAQGVGTAVNEAVVVAFMGVFAFNYVFTQTLLATNPDISTIK